MAYEEVAALAEKLGYRDKLRLAQLLIQLGRKEEEENHPDRRQPTASGRSPDPELVEYVSTRLRKLKPGKKDGVLNSIVDVLSSDTLVVAEEFGEWDDSRRRIDLPGIDKNANLVVIELKRTEDGGHMELQAIRYQRQGIDGPVFAGESAEPLA
ncbi:MAG: hypothetical protein ABIQ86_02375 [Steroidobacteraceae bacterium]